MVTDLQYSVAHIYTVHHWSPVICLNSGGNDNLFQHNIIQIITPNAMICIILCWHIYSTLKWTAAWCSCALYIFPDWLLFWINGAELELVYCNVLSLYACSVDIIEALDHSLDSHWRAFGSHLRVSTGTMDAIERDKQDARDRMLQLVEKWLEREAGTYNLPRTWRTVFQAVKSMGKRSLAQKLAQQYGVKLSGQWSESQRKLPP